MEKEERRQTQSEFYELTKLKRYQRCLQECADNLHPPFKSMSTMSALTNKTADLKLILSVNLSGENIH